jgi:heparosan-N-sulfate-glucuronate 5-epimerase
LPAGWDRLSGQLNWDAPAQWALGCHEHWLETRDRRWLDAMRTGGELLIRHIDADGGLRHTYLLGHTFPLLPPSLSAMAQGQAASVLVRLQLETGDDRFGDAALRVLEPLYVDTPAGGTRAWLDGGPWLEEYPTDPPSYVLNGGIFAIWGLYDAALGLGDARARAEFDACAGTLARNVHRWDTGRWSRYDLFPHPFLVNVASLAYHALHTNQLRAMQRIAPREEVAPVLRRFEDYAASRALRARAFGGKSAFRLAVPRNQRLARVWPGPVRGALRGAS